MLEIDKPFGILRFADGWTRRQRQYVDAVIIEKGLRVFSYPANAYVLVGQGEEIALVSQYAIDARGNTAMLLRDLVETDDPARCAFDITLATAVTKAAPIEYDLHIWGTRSSDRHWLSGGASVLTENGSKWQNGSKTFIAPLAKWSRKDVIAALKTYGIDWQQPTDNMDTGNVEACTRCLQGGEMRLCPKTKAYIPARQWDKEGNTKLIRQILGVNDDGIHKVHRQNGG